MCGIILPMCRSELTRSQWRHVLWTRMTGSRAGSSEDNTWRHLVMAAWSVHDRKNIIMHLFRYIYGKELVYLNVHAWKNTAHRSFITPRISNTCAYTCLHTNTHKRIAQITHLQIIHINMHIHSYKHSQTCTSAHAHTHTHTQNAWQLTLMI